MEQTHPEDTGEKKPWTRQKKIVVVIIGIAILVVAVAVVAKFFFHVDLLDPSRFTMVRRVEAW